MSNGNNRPNPQRCSSPEYLQMSLAAAMTLNLKEGLFFRNARLYCLNLSLTYPDGCRGNCSYCGLQKSRDGAFSEKKLYSGELAHLRPGNHHSKNPGEPAETVSGLPLHDHPPPGHWMTRCTWFVASGRRWACSLSVLMNPTSMKTADVVALRQAGGQMAAVALDLADEVLFQPAPGIRGKRAAPLRSLLVDAGGHGRGLR